MALTWSQRARQIGRRARKAGASMTRKSGQNLKRVATQAPDAARKAGKAIARHVISVQRSAGLEHSRGGPKLLERSYRSVAGTKLKGPRPSREWETAYATEAERLSPALQQKLREGDEKQARRDRAAAWAAIQPTQPDGPSWPFSPAKGPEPDEPEAGS